MEESKKVLEAIKSFAADGELSRCSRSQIADKAKVDKSVVEREVRQLVRNGFMKRLSTNTYIV